MPRLSVVIPVYNEEAILPTAAAELSEGLDQLGYDYEIIFAENGSKDATPQLLEAMCAKNPRLRWFHSETPNYGTALKRGILEARGELVVCDEIDLCDVGFYRRALPLIEKTGDIHLKLLAEQMVADSQGEADLCSAGTGRYNTRLCPQFTWCILQGVP